jgi:hypothetical protein
MSTVPPTPGYFSDNPYQVPGAPPGYDPNMPRRGMVPQIRIVAILNAIQGGLELVMSLVYLLMGGFFGLFMRAEMARNDPNGEVFANIMAGIMLVFGGVLLISSVLRFYAALRNYTLQSRVTAIVSLCLGLLSVFTGYCAPTAIGIAVYGLIVLFNKEVIEAFEMRSKGTSADDVMAHFQARPF